MQTVLLIIFIVLAGYLFWLVGRQRGQIRGLVEGWEKLQTEEGRVFDFLRGLGVAFGGEEGSGRSMLYRLIVESSAQILNAHGGVLYLRDKSGDFLTPAFVSRFCAPLIPIPAHIREQAMVNPVALESYLGLQAIHPGDGIVAQVWKEGGVRMFGADDVGLATLANEGQRASGALVAALVYRNETLGVLALINGPMASEFEQEDIQIFKAIAAQSAFALFSESVYAEAGEKRQLDRDMKTASDIQKILLPEKDPVIAGYEICGVNIPARQVSGDFFDYLQINEHQWGILIADVSGKGVPAALVASMSRSLFHSVAPNRSSAAEMLSVLNRQIYPDIKEDMFISMLYLVIDTRTSDVTMARAGHDPPFLYRVVDGKVTPLTPPGVAVGIDSGRVFDRVIADETIVLASGDSILLYTDGATEALDSNGAEFGPSRLTQAVQMNSSKGAAATVKNITKELRDFAGVVPQHDDITLISIRKL